MGVTLAGWLVSTATSGARTPGAGFVRLQSLPGLLGPGALVQAGGVVLQAELAAGVLLAVWRTGTLPAGAWMPWFAGNGVLVTALRDHYPFVVSAVLTGLVADLLASRVRGRDPRELRLLAGCVAGAFCASVFLVVGGTGGGFALPHVSGLGWSVPLWMGTSLLAGGGAWLLAFLASPAR